MPLRDYAQKSNILSEALSESLQRWGPVVRFQQHFQETKAFSVLFSRGEGLVEFVLRTNEEASSGAEDLGQAMVLPWDNVIVGAVLHLPFGAIAGVIEHNNDGVELVAHSGA